MQKSFIKWLGGKSRMADRIIQLIPAHKTYCEVFCGAAWVFFCKERSNVEIINDINLDLISLFRCIRDKKYEFIDAMKFHLHSRSDLYRYREMDSSNLSDIQRAVKMLYIIRTCFRGRAHAPSFHFSKSKKIYSRFQNDKIEKDILEAHNRLCDAIIENLDFEDMIKNADSNETFFYIDPPYYGRESIYGPRTFTRADFIRLRDLLLTVKGKFIMSINDVDYIREVFKNFKILDVPTQYSVRSGDRKNVVELLIMNFDPGVMT